MNTPPPSNNTDARTPVNVYLRIQWPEDGSFIDAEMSATDSNQAVPVTWSGSATGKYLDLPTRADACMLAAWMENLALRTAGKFSQHQDGKWAPMDEVKS